MIVLPPNVSRILNDADQRVLTIWLTVKIDFDSSNGGPLCLTNAPMDLEIAGDLYTKTYIQKASPPQKRGDFNRSLYNLIITNDDANTIYPRFNSKSSGVPLLVTVYVINDGDIDSYLENAVTVHRGKTGAFNWDSKNITIESTGNIPRMDQLAPRFTTDTVQRDYHPNDSCMRNVGITASDIRETWGR